jgi:hypothetical protein
MVMRSAKRDKGFRAGLAALATCLALPSGANTLPVGQGMEAVSARFDLSTNETRVTARIAARLCASLSLPQEWRLDLGEGRTSLRSVADDAEIILSIRSARDLQHLPQPDLPSRDAALLQSDYETTLGRPAQAVSLASYASGATRWTATWIDAQLPTASHALTVETFIVPLSDDWLLELSLDHVEARDAYHALARQALASLSSRPDCANGS